MKELQVVLALTAPIAIQISIAKQDCLLNELCPILQQLLPWFLSESLKLLSELCNP